MSCAGKSEGRAFKGAEAAGAAQSQVSPLSLTLSPLLTFANFRAAQEVPYA